MTGEKTGPLSAGWYPDTDLVDTERYWDGKAWTDKRRATKISSDEASKSNTPANLSQNDTVRKVWHFATGSPGDSKKKRYLRSSLSALLIISFLSSFSSNEETGSSTQTPQPTVSATSTQDPEPSASPKIQKGVMPDIVGMNSFDAFTILDKAGFSPSYSPTFFDDKVASNKDFKTLGTSWFVCKQADTAGVKSADPGTTTIYVSRDCTGWGSLPNTVGMKASLAWETLINRGFTPNFDYSDELTDEQKGWSVCSQDYPEGSTKTDDDIALDISQDCATSPNNPDSRNGTRIFINQSLEDIKSIESSIDSLKRNAKGNHTILINLPRLAIALEASSLGTKVPPTKFAKSWKKANQDLQVKLDRFDSALSDWIGDIINTNEFIPYIEALRSPVRNLKSIVTSIPYPK